MADRKPIVGPGQLDELASTDRFSLQSPVIVDHSSDSTTAWPVTFTHSSVFSNGGTYGRGGFRIQSTGQNNNQPLFSVEYKVDDTSYGNVGMLLRNLGSDSLVDTNVFSASMELLANNTAVTARLWNGKGEIGQASGQSAGAAKYQDGYFYVAYRRGDEHPSGGNSGFNRHLNLLPNTVIGKGELELRGYGILIDPEWDFSTHSYITNVNTFNSAILTNGSDSASTSHYARIENYGTGTGYIRNRVEGSGQSSYLYSQSDDGAAYVEVRANWVTAGTDDAELHLYVDSTGSGWVFEAKGSGEDLNIIHRVGSTATTTVNFDGASQGMPSFFRWDNSQLGRIRLGDAQGAAGGGIISYSSATGVYSLTGSYTYLTTDNSGVIEPARLEQFAPSTGGTVSPHKSTTQVILTNGALAALTIQLPATPNNTHQVVFRSSGAIASVTWSGLGGATVVGAPSALAGGELVTAIYRESVTTWYLSTSAASGGGGGTGDVVGPASATDNAVARFDTTTGKLLQNSPLIITDAGQSSMTSTSADTVAVSTRVVSGANGGTAETYVGNRNPEGLVTAAPGALYIRGNGASSRVYQLRSASSANTPWVELQAGPILIDAKGRSAQLTNVTTAVFPNYDVNIATLDTSYFTYSAGTWTCAKAHTSMVETQASFKVNSGAVSCEVICDITINGASAQIQSGSAYSTTNIRGHVTNQFVKAWSVSDTLRIQYSTAAGAADIYANQNSVFITRVSG